MFHINVVGSPAFVVMTPVQTMPAQPEGNRAATQHFVGASNVPYPAGAASAAWARAGTSTGGEIKARHSLVQVRQYTDEAPLDLSASGPHAQAAAVSRPRQLAGAQVVAPSIKFAVEAMVADAMSRATAEGKVPTWFNTLLPAQHAALQWHWSRDRSVSIYQFCDALGVERNAVLHYVYSRGALKPRGEGLLKPSDHRDAISRDPMTDLTKAETMAVRWATMSDADRAKYRGGMTEFCVVMKTKLSSVGNFVGATGKLTDRGQAVWARSNKHMIDKGYIRPDGTLTAAGVEAHASLQASAATRV